MRKNKIILIILFIFEFNCLYSQKRIDHFISKLSNNEVKYELVKVGVSTINDDKMTVPITLVNIMSVNTKSLLKKYKKNKLIEKFIPLLNNPDIDWYVNLLLYSLTQREATSLIGIENRGDWIKSNKESDLKYWSNYFSNTTISPRAGSRL